MPAQPLPEKVTYVALGDSIASGFGLGGEGACQRSSGATVETKAYSDLVRDDLERRFPGGVSGEKLACAGATAAQMRDDQVDAANRLIGNDAAVVTITVGANNYRFTDPATYGKALSPDDDVYRPWRNEIEAGLRRELVDSLLRLGGDHPNRRIFVTHYYDPFNADSVVYSVASSCRATGQSAAAAAEGSRSVDCARRTADVVDGLNNTIGGAADDYREQAGGGAAEVIVVDGVTDAFDGHEAPRPNCGRGAPDSDQAWVNSPPRPLVTEYLSGGDALDRGQDCFHLNAEGHRQLAALVISKLPNPGG